MKGTPMIPYGTIYSRGNSETARFVEEQASSGRQHLEGSLIFGMRARGAYDALCTLYEECREPNWDGYGAEPVSEDTYRAAYQFLESLPLGTPIPSVGVEADGHLTLEWYQRTDLVLSVSVSPEGMLYYAALMGSSKRSGTEPFFGEIPEDLVRIIHRIFAA